MPGRKSETFTTVELEFMQILWERKGATTEELRGDLKTRGRELADGSVRKVLSILMDKGHVRREKEGRGYRYFATERRGKAHHRLVRDLVNRAFGGSAPRLVAALLDSRDVSRDDLDEIRRMLEQYNEGGTDDVDR